MDSSNADRLIKLTLGLTDHQDLKTETVQLVKYPGWNRRYIRRADERSAKTKLVRQSKRRKITTE